NRAKTLVDKALEVWSFPSVDLNNDFFDSDKDIFIQPEYQN
ncbi:MAG: hypothetical protein RLZZ171_2425, partial [Cyanobacteriota bacterium]